MTVPAARAIGFAARVVRAMRAIAPRQVAVAHRHVDEHDADRVALARATREANRLGHRQRRRHRITGRLQHVPQPAADRGEEGVAHRSARLVGPAVHLVEGHGRARDVATRAERAEQRP